MGVEQRRTRRFSLQLPLSITRAGADRLSMVATTSNISSSGVLFTADKEPDIGGPIEYVVTLNSGREGPVSIRCIGKVVRAEKMPMPVDTDRYQVAATLERYEFVRPD